MEAGTPLLDEYGKALGIFYINPLFRHRQNKQAVFATGQVGQAATKPGLAYENFLGPGL